MFRPLLLRALPVMVAGVVPFLIARIPGLCWGGSLWGWVPVILGARILVSTALSFYRRGKGTLVPWDPPKHLIIQDLYRFNWNPMYLGVIMIVAGWAILWNPLYAVTIAIIFQLRVVLWKEPEMKRLFGAKWEDYRRRVPRWSWRF